jgi:MSHA biogenesis protein MshO
MKTIHSAPCSNQRGFTLVEAIVVMVITSIIAGVMVLFIRQPVQNYVDAAGRADMSDVADLALRRMSRELHGALPNSIRTTSIGSVALLEFIPTKSGGTYLAAEDDAGTPYLDFAFQASPPAAYYQFQVVGTAPVAPYAIAANDYVVVYNLGGGFARADAYSNSAGAMNRAQISAVNIVGGNTVVTMASNPFAVAAGTAPNSSPTHRFNVVTQPVTFRCAMNNGVGELKRYWNYSAANTFQDNQVDPETLPTKSSALLATYVTNCSFSYISPVNLQHGVVGLSLTLGRANSQDAVTLSKQVTVDNTP